MKYNWKKLTTLSLIVCLSGISITGCGSAPAAEAGTKLEAPEPIADETDAPEADTDENDVPEADTDEDDAAGTDAGEDNATGADADKDDAAGTDTDVGDADKAGSGKWHVYDPDVAAATDADFEGVVYKTEGDSFFITPTETILEENGSITAVSIAPGVEISDEELVRVVFDEQTTFTLRDIYDGGARQEDSDASFQNVEKERSVALKGEFQNDVFYADTIRIIRVHH